MHQTTLAIGSAYATKVKGGENSETEEELREAGLNRADVHVDFMIVRTRN